MSFIEKAQEYLRSVLGNNKAGSIAAVLGLGAVGFLAGDIMGAVVGLGAGVVIAPLLNELLATTARHSPLPGPKKLPGTELEAQNPIVYVEKEVAKQVVDPKNPEIKSDTIEIAEILLNDLQAPVKLIPVLTNERVEIEKLQNASKTGNISPSDKAIYANRKKELEDGDLKVAKFLMNFEKYNAEMRSEKMEQTRKRLVEVLQAAGMSEDEINMAVPRPPVAGFTMEIPSLKNYSEKLYKKGLDLYAISKNQPTEQVQAEWDGKGGFSQLNDMRNHTMFDAETEWNGADQSKSELYGLHNGKRQTTVDVKNKSALQNGEFYSSNFLGRLVKGVQGKSERWDDCDSQSICAHAVEQMMSKHPYDSIEIPKDTKGIMLPALLHTKVTDKFKEYDVRGFDLRDLSKLKNYQYLMVVAVIGTLYAEGAGDTKSKEAYEHVIRYGQACDRRLVLDGIAEDMNTYLKKLVDLRNNEIEQAQNKIAAFKNTGLAELNGLVEARKQAGVAVIRKAVENYGLNAGADNAVVVVQDIKTNQTITFFGQMKDGKFTAKEASLGQVDTKKSDFELVTMNGITNRVQLPQPTPIDLNAIEDIGRVQALHSNAATLLKTKASDLEKASKDSEFKVIEQSRQDKYDDRTAIVVSDKSGQTYKLLMNKDRQIEEMHKQKAGAKTWEERDVEKTFLLTNLPKIADASDSANFVKDLASATETLVAASKQWQPALDKAKIGIKRHESGMREHGLVSWFDITDAKTQIQYRVTCVDNKLEGIYEINSPTVKFAGGHSYTPDKEMNIRHDSPEGFIEDITKAIQFHRNEVVKTAAAKKEKKVTILSSGNTKVEYGKDSFNRKFVTYKNHADFDNENTISFSDDGKVTHFKEGKVNESNHWSNNWVDVTSLNLNIGDGKDPAKISAAMIKIYKEYRKNKNLDELESSPVLGSLLNGSASDGNALASIQISPDNDIMANLGLMSAPLVGLINGFNAQKRFAMPALAAA